MIIILRGHIRSSFENTNLLDFIKEIYNLNNNLKIYIHTWNCYSNGSSWRHLEDNYQEINYNIITNYFSELKNLIQKIIIDDDKNVNLIGNIDGNVSRSAASIKGWKFYWYGKYKIIDYLINNYHNHNELVINLRFDIFCNSFTFDKNLLLNFIKENSKHLNSNNYDCQSYLNRYDDLKEAFGNDCSNKVTRESLYNHWLNYGIKEGRDSSIQGSNNINEYRFVKNTFLFPHEFLGMDNIYIGNINSMHKLIKTFYYELDDIVKEYSNEVHQEFLVFKINEKIF